MNVHVPMRRARHGGEWPAQNTGSRSSQGWGRGMARHLPLIHDHRRTVPAWHGGGRGGTLMNTYRYILVEDVGPCHVARLKQMRLEEPEIHQLGDELLALTQAADGKVALSLGPQPPDCLYSVLLAKLISARNAARKNGGELVLCDL